MPKESYRSSCSRATGLPHGSPLAPLRPGILARRLLAGPALLLGRLRLVGRIRDSPLKGFEAFFRLAFCFRHF